MLSGRGCERQSLFEHRMLVSHDEPPQRLGVDSVAAIAPADVVRVRAPGESLGLRSAWMAEATPAISSRC